MALNATTEKENDVNHESVCPNCGRQQQEEEGAFEAMEFGASGPFSEQQEMALAMELLNVTSEEELDQFLGKVFKSAWKGIKKAGAAVGKVAGPLGSVLKGVAKTALPFVGGALGSMIPIPGVGTALGSMAGRALAGALEAETAGMDGQEAEMEMARRFVRIAGTAAQQAVEGGARDPREAVRQAVSAAMRTHVSRRDRSGARRSSGSWRRDGNSLVVTL